LQKNLGPDALFVLKRAAELNTAGKMNETDRQRFQELVSAAYGQVGIPSEPARDGAATGPTHPK
jgi:hypothetical protein